MQDLTFGEQVKIVLSRKNMTIKELAKKIEIRTKKKMSRQNLTQRLGRDNFQEQDMRMIAEILGCPFHLNILDDNIPAESAASREDIVKAEYTESTADIEGEEKTENAADAESAVETERTVSTEIAENVENIAADSAAEENGGTEKVVQEVGEGEVKEGEVRQEPAKANAEANERDITIGELVDIHEELDAMMEKATGKLPDLKEDEAEEHKGSIQTETKETQQETQETQQEMQETRQDADISEQDECQFAEGNGKDSLEEGAGEPVERLLEEIETIEKEVKKEVKKEEKSEAQEEKAHGWRAYLMQKLKKRAKEQGNNQGGQDKEDTAAKEPSYLRSQEQQVQDEAYAKEAYSEDYRGNSYTGNGYEGNVYAENGYEKNAYAENGYAENSYAENGYIENSYMEDGYMGGSYMAGPRQEGYESGYPQEMYSGEAYEEEEASEEGEKGERNPYTGKEYESNSVRMHPSRIGYVQVYDRSNHEWTDMTEWAFLGYQERKKQLLGKDYDPPIYLD